MWMLIIMLNIGPNITHTAYFQSEELCRQAKMELTLISREIRSTCVRSKQ